MFKRKEFFLASIMSFLLFLIPVFLDLLKLYQQDVSTIRPPWYYFGFSLSSSMEFDTPVVYQASFSLIVPLFSCLAYSYCYFDEKKYGLSNIIISKTNRVKYYLSSTLVSFLGGFLVVFIPLLLGSLFFFIAVPMNAYAPIEYNLLSSSRYSTINIFPHLAINFPYLYNIVYIFISSLFCGLIGLLSYSLSLYSRKNKFIVISFSFILFIISSLLCELFISGSWTLPHIMIPAFGIIGVTYSHLFIPLTLLIFINFLAIFIKIKFKKDEL